MKYPDVSTLHDSSDAIAAIAWPLPSVLDELALIEGVELEKERSHVQSTVMQERFAGLESEMGVGGRHMDVHARKHADQNSTPHQGTYTLTYAGPLRIDLSLLVIVTTKHVPICNLQAPCS